MRPFWRTNRGKLIIGGCGSQVGLLFTLGGLVIAVALCAVCLMANSLSIALTQQVANPSASVTVEVAAPSVETEALELIRARVNVLADKVSSIQTETLAPPSPTPTPPKPLATAHESGVNLRSGPSLLYHRIGRLPRGESLEIVGRNADSSWWLVATADGSLAWLSDMVVATSNVDDSIPLITIPALLVQPAATAAGPTDNGNGEATVSPAPTPSLPQPAGTPTPVANLSRRFVQDTTGYKQLIRRLLLPTVSESFSPDGQQIALTEKIKLYTIRVDGANSRILLDDDDLTLVGGAVWSPDGQYLAFVAERLQDCHPCRIVGLVRLADGQVTFLEPPPNSALDKPRWTQDGRLLVTAFLEESSGGAPFIYDLSGQGQPATGRYLLSSSHDGQKWFPWQPGRIWQVEGAERPDSYYGD